MIKELSSYSDLMKKLEYDLKKFADEENVFHLLDCVLTLNAIPEWIVGDTSAPDSLRAIAQDKLLVMKGQKRGFRFDESLIDSDINHKLHLVRLIANHSKHKTDATRVPHIQSAHEAGFPYTLPIGFDYYLVIGESRFHASYILESISSFWKDEIVRCM